MSEAPFVVGDRVMNTANRDRKTLGIVTRVIDHEYCDVLWSTENLGGEVSAWQGTIRRNGTLPPTSWDSDDRIVRVKLSVRVPAREN